MKILRPFVPAFAAILCFGVMPLFAGYNPPSSDRLDLNFNYDWKFIKEDVKGGAEAPGFDDSSWASVSLPHSWNDDKFRNWVFDEKGVYYGKGWYRKHFTLDPSWRGRRVLVEFQGIGRVADFYVNGTKAGAYGNGVAPCGIDITDQVKFGADNVIAVVVDSAARDAHLPYGQPFNPIFGGINRDVILHITGKVHLTLPLYRNLGTVGTYIYPADIDTLNKSATIHIEPEVKNDDAAPRTVECTATVVDDAGNAVLTETSPGQTIAPGATAVFAMSGKLAKTHLWSPDYPYLYKVYTTLTSNGKALDVNEITTGFRRISFSAATGLLVNGRPLYLKGYAPRTSMEWPCVATPVDWMQELDFKLMREDNGNFCRPMHIAPQTAQVQAADKFGIVMACPAANNEGDGEGFDTRLEIMRDVTIAFRNDPSVFFFEACNQTMSGGHMQAMKDVRIKWDPNGGRMAGLRSNDTAGTDGVREYGATMDGAGNSAHSPTWDAEYARAEGPRRVWDDYTPMLNPRWDGKNPDPAPAPGTVGDTTHKYLLGGYFYIA
jgi:beta-galactosidase